MTTVLTLCAIALSYLRRGWSVIPVPFKQKKPGFSNWQRTRLTEDDLTNAFPNRPMNISVLVGKPSGGLADIDLDVPLAILLAPRFLPRTDAIFGRDSARRAHWLYQIVGAATTLSWEDPTIDKDDESGERGMLVEFRFSGHTLFPGSTHPSGEPITWDAEGEPLAIATIELRPKLNRLASAVLLARHWPRQGSRHQAALALAGGLLRAGWSVDDVITFMDAITTGAGDEEAEDRRQAVVTSGEAFQAGRSTTGWPTLEQIVDPRVVRAVRGWLGIVSRDPDPKSEPESVWKPPTPLPEGQRPPFPVDTLPPILRAFVDALSIATQTPPALAALIVLAVLAAAVANRVVVRIRGSWREPVNLFIAVALGPANRKSAVFSECAKPLEDFERAEMARLAPEIAAQKSALKIKRKRLEALERTAAKADGENTEAAAAARDEAATLAREIAETTVLEPPRLFVDDCSQERLATLMTTHQGRIAALSAEGGIFGMMAGRYSANSEPNLDVYLKAHAGEPLRVDRVGREPDYVPRPALTIGLAVQPGVIARLAEKPQFRERGLPARFLFGLPFTFVGRRQIAPPAMPEAVRAAYHATITVMLQLPHFVDAQGDPLPKDLELTPEAEQLVQRFEERLEPRLGDGGDLEHIADWAGKLVGATCRIAGLFHVSVFAAQKHPWDVPVPAPTIVAAIQIAENFLIPHALTAFAAMGADPDLETAKKILRWIERADVKICSLRDIHQDLRKHDLTNAMVESGVILLIDHDYLRLLPERSNEPERTTGRPRSPQYVVNPLWRPQKTQKAQNADEDADSGGFEGFESFEEGSSTQHTNDLSESFEPFEEGTTSDSSTPDWDEEVF